jgi:Secretion system C-terminal sorting domain
MRRIIIVLVLASVSLKGFSQANIASNGNWDDATRWTGSNIGDVVTEDVTMANNRDITVRNGFSYTIGTFTTGNNAVLTIQSTGVLNVGDASNPDNLSVPNGLNLTVNGTLHIFGNLIVNNNITIAVTGTLIIEGDVQLNNGASLTVTSGSISVGGNFTGGNNTAISITSPGSVNVDGNFDVGNGSTLGGDGTLGVGGSCTGPVCSDPQLPVTLTFFKGSFAGDRVSLSWSTSSELNFDYFLLEKSVDGSRFFEIARIKGHGTSFETHNYSFEDFEFTSSRSYYRLTSVDFDGYRETFDVIAVSAKALAQATVYPNPLETPLLHIDFGIEPIANMQISISDMRGVVLANHQTTSRENQIELHNLAPGLYLVTITSPEFRDVRKLIVR